MNARELFASTLDVLLTRQPGRTCLGAAVGLGLSIAATPLLRTPEIAEAAGSLGLQVWHWAAFGIVLAHVPTALLHYRGPANTDEGIVSALNAIESSLFTPEERAEHYRDLLSSVYSRATKQASEQ